MVFEKKNQKLISDSQFIRRQIIFSLIAFGIIFISLLIGILGYRYSENLPWIDCLLNASMILGGMGEVDVLKTNAGKLFASFYAIYSGLVVIAAVGVLSAPLIHRLFHRFHLIDEEKDED